MLAGEVVAIDILPIPAIGQVLHADLLKVVVDVLASLLKGSFEILTLTAELLLAVLVVVALVWRVGFSTGLSERKFFAGDG